MNLTDKNRDENTFLHASIKWKKTHTLQTNAKLHAETAQPEEKRGCSLKGLHITCQMHSVLRLSNGILPIADLFVEKMQQGRPKEQNVFPFLPFLKLNERRIRSRFIRIRPPTAHHSTTRFTDGLQATASIVYNRYLHFVPNM